MWQQENHDDRNSKRAQSEAEKNIEMKTKNMDQKRKKNYIYSES